MKKQNLVNNITVDSKLTFVNNIVQSLDALRIQRDEWEKTDYKKANDGLYNLLGTCKRIYSVEFINGDEGQRKELRSNLMARLKADGIKVQRNSPVITMFVRFVFNSDRKRAHLYSYVLKAAISDNVKHDEMATWISSQGGIEEIRRKSVVSEKTLQKREKLESAKQAVSFLIGHANGGAFDPWVTYRDHVDRLAQFSSKLSNIITISHFDQIASRAI